MKVIMIKIRIIFLPVLLLFCFHSELFSQGTSTNKGEKPGLFAGISVGPSRSGIINSGTLSISELITEKKGSFIGILDIGYFLSENLGFSSGIGLISYTSQQTLGSYQNKLNSTDSENELYEMRISGSDITETQKIGTLIVPLNIIARLPMNEKLGFYLQPGVLLSFPVNKDFNSNGTFTYKGYYPAYNVVFENLPAYGFPSNLSNSGEGDLELKPIIFNFSFNAGIDYFIQQKIQLAFGVSYIRSLSNISNYTSPDNFQLSPDADHLSSLMGGSTKVTIQSIGLTIVMRYYLK